ADTIYGVPTGYGQNRCRAACLYMRRIVTNAAIVGVHTGLRAKPPQGGMLVQAAHWHECRDSWCSYRVTGKTTAGMHACTCGALSRMPRYL
ncbi:MAG: hypothetical protein RSC68_34850, partial [Acinetobacter sp.]